MDLSVIKETPLDDKCIIEGKKHDIFQKTVFHSTSRGPTDYRLRHNKMHARPT